MKRNKFLPVIFLIFSLIMLLVFSVTIIASEQDLIKESLSFLEKQDYQSAAHLLEEALSIIWNKSPLELNNLIFCEEKPDGFGFYQKRIDYNFTEGDTFCLYAEPKYYSIVKIEENLFEVHFKGDLYILDTEGALLWGQRDLWDYHIISNAPNKEIFITYSDSFLNFPEGEYQFQLVLKDVASQKTVEQAISFVIE
ncbi:MAG TPA: hypothetical protein PKJ95_01175 [Atribacterota bacterium]|nr:hypothetical protein [Atribacterota bacterium]